MKLEAEIIMKLHVKCGRDMEVGDDGKGFLRVIPIQGGSFDGMIKGEIIPGGADWNTSYQNGGAHVYAKYLLRTDDGIYISVENEGMIKAGEETQIKTTPCFQVRHDSRYSWLNSGIYAGSLTGGVNEGEVEITFYKMG